MKTLRVTITSNVPTLVITIVKIISKDKALKINSIGTTATNKTVKAIKIARASLKKEYLDLNVKSRQIEHHIQGEDRAAIQLMVTAQAIPKNTPTQGFTPLEY